MKPKLILGSSSPRRRELLSGLGAHFDVVNPGVEEVVFETDPLRTVLENAAAKHQGVASQLNGPAWILTADTVVSFDGSCYLKPDSREQAVTWFRRFSGRAQYVHTGFSWGLVGSSPMTEHETSTVWFKSLSETDIADYLRAVDPMDKAGGYDINENGDSIIQRWEGSKSNIMGLPVERIRVILLKEGLL